MIYCIFQVGEKRIRVSTNLKAKEEYWNKGIVIPQNGMLSEKHIHKLVDAKLNEVKQNADEVFYNYLCANSTDEENLIKNIRYVINPMKKKAQPQSIVSLLSQTVRDTPNEKTQRSQLAYVRKFGEYLKERKLKDEINSLNQKNIEDYRDWIEKKLSSSTAKNNLTNLLTIIKKVERKYEVFFGIDKNRIEPIVDKRTREEKNKNYVALTKEDLEKLKSVDDLTENQSIVRDLFLLQCYTSVRHEDLEELLNTDNQKVIESITYCIFSSEKTKITYHIPLDNTDLFPETIELVRKYANAKSLPSRDTYNYNLKTIAKKAKLDTIFNFTSEKGGKKEVTQMKVYEAISSHWGRHTCITNLVRYYGMQPKDIKYISGHADETMITQTYINTTVEDNVRAISKALAKGKTKRVDEVTPSKPNYGISGLDEAKSVMRYLGISFADEVTFEEALRLIGERQWEIIDNYGVSVDLFKALYNLGLPMSKRVDALREILQKFNN